MQRYDSGEGLFLQGLIQTALGVFIGGLAAMFVYEEVAAWRLEQAPRKAAALAAKHMGEAKAADARERAAREAVQTRARQEAEARRSALALAARLEKERQARKEAAWNRFFTPSPECRADPGQAVCANQHMAAKKRFEAEYVDR